MTTNNSEKLQRIKKLILKIAFQVFLWFTVSILLFILIVRLGFFGALPDYKELRHVKANMATNIYSVDNKLIGRYYYQNRTNATLNEIPKEFIEALVATEDVRYYKHNGVDFRSTMRVLVKSVLLFNRSAGGGSTITQQLAKNLYPRKRYGIFTIPVAKVREIIIAKRLEKIYTKDEILEMYLNTVSFGENTYGIETAAIIFFGKQPQNLQLEESAMLVGLLKANSSYNPHSNPDAARERRNVVLGQMVKYGYLESDKAEVLKQLPIDLNYRKLTHDEGPAPYFREYIRHLAADILQDLKKRDGSSYNLYSDGLRIYTTLNGRMQEYAEKAVYEHMSGLQSTFDKHWRGAEPWKKSTSVLGKSLEQSSVYKSNIAKGLSKQEAIDAMRTQKRTKIFDWDGECDTLISPLDSLIHHFKTLQTGVLIMNAQNGDILAWVGGSNYKYFQYDHVTAKRQTGSTIKPIIYANALRDSITPCDFFANDSIVYEDYDNWTPRNSDGKYGGYYSVKGALANSVNTVSVQLLMQSGIENAIELVHQFGIESYLPEVPSLALGTGEVSLYEMVKAYSTFLNDGMPVEPRLIRRIEDNLGRTIYSDEAHEPTDSVISAELANTILAMMQGVVDRGTANSLRTVYGFSNELAGKTGTTQKNTDGWFMGLTPRLVMGAWVGGDNPIVRFRTTAYGQGAYAAMPIIAKFLQQMYNDPKYAFMQNESFEIPDSIYQKMNCIDYDEDEPIDIFEYFKQEDADIRELIKQLFGKKKRRERND